MNYNIKQMEDRFHNGIKELEAMTSKRKRRCLTPLERLEVEHYMGIGCATDNYIGDKLGVDTHTMTDLRRQLFN